MPILKSREGEERAKDLEGPSSELEEKSGTGVLEAKCRKCFKGVFNGVECIPEKKKL